MTVTEFPVLEAATGRTLRIPTANMMTTWRSSRACRRRSATRSSRGGRADFKPLLERHGIPFEKLDRAEEVRAERARSCASRTSSTRSTRATRAGRSCRGSRRPRATPGTLWVPLEGEAAVRAALVLEPAALYGVYEYPRFKPRRAGLGSLPVRVVR